LSRNPQASKQRYVALADVGKRGVLVQPSMGDTRDCDFARD